MDLHVFDDANHLFLTAYDLPRFDAFEADRSGDNGRGWKSISTDEAWARILQLTARPFVRWEAYGPPFVPAAGTVLETCLLRPAAECQGRHREYFNGRSSRYRLALHRTARNLAKHPSPLVWDQVYHKVDRDNPSQVVRHPVTNTALHAGAVVLEEGLAVYRSGSNIRAFVDGLGHPYVHVGSGADI